MGRLTLEDGRCIISCQPGPERGPLNFFRAHDSQDHRPTLCAHMSGLPHLIALSAKAHEQSSLQAACNLHEKMSRDFCSGAQGDHLQPVWPPWLFCRSVARHLPCLLPGVDRHIPSPGVEPASGTLLHSSLFQLLSWTPYTHLQHTCMMTHFGHLSPFWHWLPGSEAVYKTHSPFPVCLKDYMAGLVFYLLPHWERRENLLSKEVVPLPTHAWPSSSTWFFLKTMKFTALAGSPTGTITTIFSDIWTNYQGGFSWWPCSLI